MTVSLIRDHPGVEHMMRSSCCPRIKEVAVTNVQRCACAFLCYRRSPVQLSKSFEVDHWSCGFLDNHTICDIVTSDPLGPAMSAF